MNTHSHYHLRGRMPAATTPIVAITCAAIAACGCLIDASHGGGPASAPAGPAAASEFGSEPEFMRRARAFVSPRPRDVRTELDVVFRTVDGEQLKLDVYDLAPARQTPATQPTGAPRRRPAIVYFHGGGWKIGDKSYSKALFYEAARRGFVLFSVNYRLVPGGRFPRNVQDCAAAVCWARANAERYMIDPDRIGIMGTSAGAHLAALVGLSRDDDFPTPDIANVSARVAAVVCYFGPFDLRGYGDLVGGLINEYLGVSEALHPDVFRRASPVTYVDRFRHASRPRGGGTAATQGSNGLERPAGARELPPFLFVHGDADDLVSVEQSRRMYAALRSIHARAELLEVRGGQHGLMHGEMDPPPAVFRNRTFEFLADPPKPRE